MEIDKLWPIIQSGGAAAGVVGMIVLWQWLKWTLDRLDALQVKYDDLVEARLADAVRTEKLAENCNRAMEANLTMARIVFGERAALMPPPGGAG